MSAFAWWEWGVLVLLVYTAWAIGYSSGTRYGAERGARQAYEHLQKALERIAEKQNEAADRLNTVCDMFQQTVVLLDKVGKGLGGRS